MKCEIVIQNIDRYFCKELPEIDAETRQHLASCRDCKLYFTAQEETGDIITRIADFEPVLNDPAGLTNKIMEGLSDAEKSPEVVRKITTVTIFKSIHLRRVLSAAAIVLFAVFGVEQYMVLDKINQLETQYQNVPEAKFSRKDLKTLNSWEIRTLRSFNQVKKNNMVLFEKINSMANNI